MQRPMTVIDKQRAFVAKVEAIKMPCPTCGHPQSVAEAARNDGGKETHQCVKCERRLEHIVPFGPMTPPWLWS